MSDDTLKTNLLNVAESAFGPSLRSDETIVIAGNAMIPPAWWTHLLLIGNLMKTLQTYLVILTNQRLVLVRTTSWAGKITPASIVIKHQYELRSLRGASLQNNAAVLDTAQGQVKLVGVRLIGMPLTPSNFLSEIVSQVNRK